MMYYMFSDMVCEKFGYPKVGITGSGWKRAHVQLADLVFTYVDGRMNFVKVRTRPGPRYTEEDMVILRLKAVPLD